MTRHPDILQARIDERLKSPAVAGYDHMAILAISFRVDAARATRMPFPLSHLEMIFEQVPNGEFFTERSIKAQHQIDLTALDLRGQRHRLRIAQRDSHVGS